MKTVYYFLKETFLPKEKELSLQNYISALNLLWFINSVTLVLPLIMYSFSAIYGSMANIEKISALSIQQNFSSLFFSIPIPWLTFLLAGNILLMTRVLGKTLPLAVRILAGVLSYLSFRAIPALTFYFMGYPDLMTHDSILAALTKRNMNIYMIILIPLTIAGIVFMLLPLFSLKKAETEEDTTGINRAQYNQGQLLISLFSLLTLLAFLFSGRYILDNEFDNPVLLTMTGIVLGVLSIINLILVIFRMINSPASPLWFLTLIASLIFLSLGYGLIILVADLRLHPISVFLITTGIYIPLTLNLWLIMSGQKKRNFQ